MVNYNDKMTKEQVESLAKNMDKVDEFQIPRPNREGRTKRLITKYKGTPIKAIKLLNNGWEEESGVAE